MKVLYFFAASIIPFQRSWTLFQFARFFHSLLFFNKIKISLCGENHVDIICLIFDHCARTVVLFAPIIKNNYHHNVFLKYPFLMRKNVTNKVIWNHDLWLKAICTLFHAKSQTYSRSVILVKIFNAGKEGTFWKHFSLGTSLGNLWKNCKFQVDSLV